jgi:hypothetical protein
MRIMELAGQQFVEASYWSVPYSGQLMVRKQRMSSGKYSRPTGSPCLPTYTSRRAGARRSMCSAFMK